MDSSHDGGRPEGEETVRRGRKPKRVQATDIARGLFETDRPGGLHERVRRSLVHAITSGKYGKGARLPSEPELAATFGVSRPVVRQALEGLRGEGLIESLRGSGNYVTGLDAAIAARLLSAPDTLIQMQQVMDDLEFRLVIEPEAAFHAARRRSAADVDRMEQALRRFEEAHDACSITHHFDFLFHEAIALATTNQHFVNSVRSLEYRPDDARIIVRHLIHFQPSDRGLAVLREHAAVLDLIRERDAEAAKQAMWKHLEAARTRLIAHITEQNQNRSPLPRRAGT